MFKKIFQNLRLFRVFPYYVLYKDHRNTHYILRWTTASIFVVVVTSEKIVENTLRKKITYIPFLCSSCAFILRCTAGVDEWNITKLADYPDKKDVRTGNQITNWPLWWPTDAYVWTPTYCFMHQCLQTWDGCESGVTVCSM